MLKPSLQLRLTQQLTMTPQLQQAIRLLQLPVMELQLQIQQALEQNVMLEIEEPELGELDSAESLETHDVHNDDSEEPEIDVRAETEWEDVQRTGPSEAPRVPESTAPYEPADRSEETLADHLLGQLGLAKLDARGAGIGHAVIDAINDDGYLTDDLETIRATLAPDLLVAIPEIEGVLALIQEVDPAGVGGRSVSECVQLQLRQAPPDVPGVGPAGRVAAGHVGL